MPVPSVMGDLSATAASNSPSGSDPISNSLDNYIRAHAAIVRSTNHKATDIASAPSVAIGAAAGEFIDITGSVGITSFDSVSAGITRTLRFTGAPTITHSSNIQLPGSVDYVCTSGDVLQFRSLGPGQWKCTSGVILSNEASASDAYGMADSRKAMTTRRLRNIFYTAYFNGDPTPSLISSSANAAGWTIVWNSSGRYTVTHNLTLSNVNNFLPVVTPVCNGTIGSGVSRFASIDNTAIAANSFVVSIRDENGVFQESDFIIHATRIGA